MLPEFVLRIQFVLCDVARLRPIGIFPERLDGPDGRSALSQGALDRLCKRERQGANLSVGFHS
jgi:hypothetical protein